MLANSSKVCGRRWFFIFHPNNARLSDWTCVGPFGPLSNEAGGGVGCIRFAGTEFAGVAVAAELAAGGGATGDDTFFDFPHPPPATKARMTQRIPAPGFQRSGRPRFEICFMRIIVGLVKKIAAIEIKSKS